MDVSVSSYVNALNGTTVKIPCIFTSCYKIDTNKFAMNWTYQETLNDTEEMVILNCIQLQCIHFKALSPL